MSETPSTDTGTDGGKPDGAEAPEPTIEDLQKALEERTEHARKWEARAKANKDKADRLDSLEAEKMTDAEKATAALTAAQTEAQTATERAEKAEAALARYEIATEFGLDADDVKALSSISDPDALRSLAERLASRSTGPQPNPAQGRNRGSAAQTTEQAFADALADLGV